MDEKTAKNAQLLVSRAKIAMFESHPFYAHILTRLRVELVDQLPGGSVSATDGRKLYVSAEKYAALPKAEQLTVLAHEQMHCLDGHLWRRGQRDPQWSNIAQDIYIYHVLCADGFAIIKHNEVALEGILQKFAKGKFS